MSNFGQMQSDLLLSGMNNLNSTDAGSLINRANREEVENWDWSFLYRNIIINAITPYTTGTVTMTQGSQVVTGVGTAFTPSMENWWIRVGATLTTPVKATYVSPTQLDLSTGWGAPTAVNTGYFFFPLYYDVTPLIEVQRVRQVAFLVETSQEALNRIDPSRMATGGSPSLRWSPGPYTNPESSHPGDFQIELWPVPAGALPYIVDGKLGPIDMVNPTDLPQVPSAVLVAKAMMYLCRAAMASNANPKWGQLADMYKSDFEREQQNARTADDRRKVTLGIKADDGFGLNSGLDYFANHDSSGPPYVGGS